MQRLTYRQWVPRLWVARPLLSFDKQRLIATCEMRDLEFVCDPSNLQPVFDRVRVRMVRRDSATCCCLLSVAFVFVLVFFHCTSFWLWLLWRRTPATG